MRRKGDGLVVVVGAVNCEAVKLRELQVNGDSGTLLVREVGRL